MARGGRLETGAARTFPTPSQTYADHSRSSNRIEQPTEVKGGEGGCEQVCNEDARHGRGQRSDPSHDRGLNGINRVLETMTANSDEPIAKGSLRLVPDFASIVSLSQ